MSQQPLTILCVASHLKGFHFIREARRLGCRVYLLTHTKLLEKPWPREALEDVYALENFDDMAAVRNTVSYLYRTIKFDRLVPLGDYDVEVTADLREHLRMPGMGVTASRFWRDKLAMRQRAEAHHVTVPAFTPLLNYADIDAFMRRVPGPWVLKPRAEAASKGIQVIHHPDELWRAFEELGDAGSHHLLEQFVEGDVYHVDGVVHDGRVVFASVQKYGKPILKLRQAGGVYTSRTIERGTPDEVALQALNKRVVTALGLEAGVTHIEYIKSRETGDFHFLEAAMRVGAGKISDVVFYATGVCVWHEWAKLEAATPDRPYVAPTPKNEHAGVVLTVAREEQPSYHGYTDPEIVWRMKGTKPYHAGLLVQSPHAGRVEELVADYTSRMARDYAPEPSGIA